MAKGGKGKERAFEVINPPGQPEPVGHYVYATKLKPGASLIFVSGLAPRDDGGKGLIGYDCYTQTCRVMERLQIALEACGATLDDVVCYHVYLTDINDVQKCVEARKKYCRNAAASSLVAVKGLALGQLVEIEAIAAV